MSIVCADKEIDYRRSVVRVVVLLTPDEKTPSGGVG